MSMARSETLLFVTSRRAFARLADGGRLVAITGAGLSPDAPQWREAFITLQERGRVVFSAAIDGRVYAPHGTTRDAAHGDREGSGRGPGEISAPRATAPDVATLLEWVLSDVPARAPVAPTSIPGPAALRRAASMAQRPRSPRAPSLAPRVTEPSAIELEYETEDWKPSNGGSLSDAIYEGYVLQSIRFRTLGRIRPSSSSRRPWPRWRRRSRAIGR